MKLTPEEAAEMARYLPEVPAPFGAWTWSYGAWTVGFEVTVEPYTREVFWIGGRLASIYNKEEVQAMWRKALEDARSRHLAEILLLDTALEVFDAT